jgi:hypothetical protein
MTFNNLFNQLPPMTSAHRFLTGPERAPLPKAHNACAWTRGCYRLSASVSGCRHTAGLDL